MSIISEIFSVLTYRITNKKLNNYILKSFQRIDASGLMDLDEMMHTGMKKDLKWNLRLSENPGIEGRNLNR